MLSLFNLISKIEYFKISLNIDDFTYLLISHGKQRKILSTEFLVCVHHCPPQKAQKDLSLQLLLRTKRRKQKEWSTKHLKSFRHADCCKPSPNARNKVANLCNNLNLAVHLSFKACAVKLIQSSARSFARWAPSVIAARRYKYTRSKAEHKISSLLSTAYGIGLWQRMVIVCPRSNRVFSRCRYNGFRRHTISHGAKVVMSNLWKN